MGCFNPRPARGPGAAVYSIAKMSCAPSFNPRPARGPGAAAGGFDQPRIITVSILAQPGGRALHGRLKPQPGLLRVSILAQPGGRALPNSQTLTPQGFSGFNPRPARGPGAAPSRFPAARSAACFNPRPARGPGAADDDSWYWQGALFQSSPSPGAGRCRHHPIADCSGSVSILAQPGGRALPAMLDCLTDLLLVSILAQPGGRALPEGQPSLVARVQVSILAQPGGRALPTDRQQQHALLHPVSILAQPGGRALRSHGGRRGGNQQQCFNPRPARGPGAASSLPMPCESRCCFNPRPARGPGAAFGVHVQHPSKVLFQSSPSPGAGRCPMCRPYPLQCQVSILAQPGGRALLSGDCLKPRGRQGFQSSPSPGAGRCCRSPQGGRMSLTSCFNPRPARGPGAATAQILMMGAMPVSILAQPGGRALRAVHKVDLREGAFVSILAQPGGRALPKTSDIQYLIKGGHLFQSSPSPGAGRCCGAGVVGAAPRAVSILAQPGGRALRPSPASWTGSTLAKFQSSPSPGAGRCLLVIYFVRLSVQIVSILAQPGGRALR